jgi:hypothetical protein
LRQDPFLEGPPLGQGAQLPFPDLTEENDAGVRAAKVFLRAIGECTLANLRHIVLRMHQGDLVSEKAIQVSETYLA